MEKGDKRSTGLFERGRGQRLPGDKQDVGAGRKIRQEALHGSPQETLGSVPLHRLSNGPPGCHSHTQMRLVTVLDNQDNKRVGIRLAKTPHPLEIS